MYSSPRFDGDNSWLLFFIKKFLSNWSYQHINWIYLSLKLGYLGFLKWKIFARAKKVNLYIRAIKALQCENNAYYDEDRLYNGWGRNLGGWI